MEVEKSHYESQNKSNETRIEKLTIDLQNSHNFSQNLNNVNDEQNIEIRDLNENLKNVQIDLFKKQQESTSIIYKLTSEIQDLIKLHESDIKRLTEDKNTSMMQKSAKFDNQKQTIESKYQKMLEDQESSNQEKNKDLLISHQNEVNSLSEEINIIKTQNKANLDTKQ